MCLTAHFLTGHTEANVQRFLGTHVALARERFAGLIFISLAVAVLVDSVTRLGRGDRPRATLKQSSVAIVEPLGAGTRKAGLAQVAHGANSVVDLIVAIVIDAVAHFRRVHVSTRVALVAIVALAARPQPMAVL